MPKYGVLNECNRCGLTIFREKIGTGEMDGGYTKWDKFEPFPKTWLSSHYGTFCPVCSKEFKRIITGFFYDDAKLPNEIRNYGVEEPTEEE